MSTRLLRAGLVSACAALQLLGCRTDGDAELGEAPKESAKLAVELSAARPQRELEVGDVRNVLEEGLALELSGQLDAALRLYDQALEEPGASLEILERKALVLSWLKRFEESRVSFQRVLKDARSNVPQKRRVRRNLAELLAWESEFDEALVELERLLDEDSTDCEARLLRGEILEWQGRYPEAKMAYSKILETDAKHDEARRRLDKLLWVP